MIKHLQQLALAAATLSLSLVAIGPVRSATLTYNFSGSTDSGFLAGETYSGFLSFDDSNITGSGREFLTLTDLDFDFSNPVFSNADPISVAEASFFNGTFVGLSFSAETYSFVPGFFEVGEASFAYQVNQEGGAGDVNYRLQTSQTPVPEPVPEPTFAAGLLLFGVAGMGLKLKRKMEWKKLEM
ncbi:MAG: hypothetical protein HC894_31685 [Microcoleus sp. SM1_3_4]|nr:hypothetical protein [Microcoleus sp. SM1_3_4]